MKPLLVLLAAFAISICALRLFAGDWDYVSAGNIAMASMLLFTAIGHFAFTKGMAMMLPGFVPFKKLLVYITGVIEIVAGVGLLVNSVRVSAAVFLIFFFVILLPANIYAAMKGVDYQTGSYGGNGLTYLWFRVPLQLLFIAWVAYFGLYTR